MPILKRIAIIFTSTPLTMEQPIEEQQLSIAKKAAEGTVFSILLTISFSHLLNDTIQSLIPSIYPIVKDSFHLNFGQVGLITLTFQLAASLFQPFVGFYTDKKPQPFSLATGMAFTLVGLVCLAFASSFGWILVSVGLIGTGSSVFHPEASKVAYMASGGRRGLGAIHFPGGWQCRKFHWSFARGFDHRSFRAKEHCMVFCARLNSHPYFNPHRQMVPAKYATDSS